jgi:hypothetical protein
VRLILGFAMPFREKSAWISLVTTFGVYAYYFWNVMQKRGEGGPSLLGLLIGCIVILIVLQVIFHIAWAIRTPRDAMTPQDEREKLIALKSTNIAFYIVASGAVIAAAGLMFVGQAFIMANLLLLALVLAELAKYASQIVFFRRGV